MRSSSKLKANRRRHRMVTTRKEEKEPYKFDGPSMGQAQISAGTSLRDLLEQSGLAYSDWDFKLLMQPVNTFIEEWYNSLLLRKTATQVEDYAKLCKERRNDLLNFCNLLLSASEPGKHDQVFIINDHKDDDKILLDLSDIKYLPKHMKGFIEYDPNSEMLLDRVILSGKPRIYTYLYKYVLRMFSLLKDSNIPEEYRTLLILFPVSIGQLYERLNTSGEVRERYERETLDLLTRRVEDPNEEFWDLFNSVIEDLDLNNQERRHHKYVRQLRKAWNEVRDTFMSPYSLKDYYTAIKGTASEIIGQPREKSLVASLYETDPIKDIPAVKAFDTLIGYESGYRRFPISTEYRDYLIKTIMIDNPSKMKPRAIHISDNAIQDRCSFIHKRLKRLLVRIESDCTINHYKGVSFLNLITSKEYRSRNRNTIYCFDFSNATDTLNQTFQEKCLGLFFPQEVVEFWHIVSTLDKTFIHSDGTCETYHQYSGQPQGLLGSFDAFAIAHHILMLMVMKRAGLEDQLASDFYRVLGDDSAINSIIEETTPGSVGEDYAWVCEQVNWILNRDKSTIIDPLNENAMTDFAKVTVRNGKVFSPIPSGLILNYTSEEVYNDVATQLWITNEYRIPCKVALDRIIDRRFTKEEDRIIIKSIIKSGEIEFLKDYSDPSWKCIPSLKGAAIYSYGISLFKDSIIGFMMSNTQREKVKANGELFADIAWRNMIPTKFIEELLNTVPSNHKYWMLLEESSDLADNIQSLFECDEAQSHMLAEVLFTKEISDTFGMINDLDLLLEENKDSGDIPESISGLSFNYLFNSLEDLQGLQLRSVEKKQRQRANFLGGCLKEFWYYFRNSEDIKEMLNSCQELNREYKAV